MVTVDLRKGRHFDRSFDFDVRYDGLDCALQNWLIRDKEYNFREGLLNLWIDGMRLKSIAALSGMRTSDLSKKLKSQKEMYFERCKAMGICSTEIGFLVRIDIFLFFLPRLLVVVMKNCCIDFESFIHL
jgi:hypothetical protein